MPDTAVTIDPRLVSVNLGMMAQPSGWIGPSEDNMFFALLPDAATVERIAMLARLLRNQHGLRGRVQARTFHAVLYPLMPRIGATYDEVASRAVRAAATIVAAPFEVAFDCVLTLRRAGTAPLVLACDSEGDGPASLKRAIEGAMALADLPPSVGNELYLTLLHDEKPVERAILHHPIGWMAREFVLVCSLRALGRYQCLGRWPLRG